MFKKSIALAVASTLAVASFASAAATFSVTQYPQTQLPAAYQAGYNAYLVTFNPTAGDKLVGFVISPLAGGVAGTGLTGTLLQRFTSNGDTYDPTPFVAPARLLPEPQRPSTRAPSMLSQIRVQSMRPKT